METPTITPVTGFLDEQTQTRLTIAPTIRASDGSEYAFNGTGYTQIVAPWAVDNHIPPVKASERFGDVPSWVAYVERYAGADQYAPLVTWSERGLRAVLDYHASGDEPDRCQWIAEHPFELTSQWKAWTRLADGSVRSQKQLVEAFEDLSEDIVEPDAATVVTMLRTLRGTLNTTAATDLNADGSTRIDFTRNTSVQAGSATLPPTITIGVPVLKGHTEEQEGEDGAKKQVPVLYRLPVRVRPSVGENAKLEFRLSMPTAERVLEAVYADRVASAKQLLGDTRTLLRAAS